MKLQFPCPNCGHFITEEDFSTNEHMLANLKSIFNKHEEDYIKNLRAQLVIDLQEQQKNELSRIVAEKENQFNKLKQEELDKLNQIISNQNIELSNNKVNLEKLLVEKEKQFIEKQNEVIANYENELKLLNSQIGELKIANATNKVIQNKIKGENFEHEVYGELLKVFEDDKVTKITSQDKKADYLQEVIIDNRVIGKIVYEVKNAEWSNSWEKKLIEDMAKQGSKYGILVATSFNKKYPGIPFKKSDENTNIYLCDADNFIFIGQIIKTIIKIEYKLNSQRQITNYDEKIRSFNSWKEVQLPKLIKIFEDSFTRIKEAEASITKKVDDIRIAREKMYNNALRNIREFLEAFSF